jgi:hypothetical protein
MPAEIVFVVEKDAEGRGFSASWDAPEGGGITTEGRALSELETNIIEAVRLYFDTGLFPMGIRFRF